MRVPYSLVMKGSSEELSALTLLTTKRYILEVLLVPENLAEYSCDYSGGGPLGSRQSWMRTTSGW